MLICNTNAAFSYFQLKLNDRQHIMLYVHNNANALSIYRMLQEWKSQAIYFVSSSFSYMGGANFWGGTKADDNFTEPSFDDKILEVVAVFGSMQLGISKVINLQHHRIAQVSISLTFNSHSSRSSPEIFEEILQAKG